jgi:hypothetical protein
MGRKTEFQKKLDNQIAHLEAEQKRCKNTKEKLAFADRIAKLYRQRWPDPLADVKAQTAATKLELKLQKRTAAQAEKAEADELERLREVERRKIRDEANPVADHVKRAVIRAQIHQERAQEPLPEASLDVPPLPEVITPVSDVQPADRVVVSPEIAAITREAEAAAKRNSTKRDDVLDLFQKATQPLEPRDGVLVVPAPRRFLADFGESSGPGETSARLAASEHASEVRGLSPANKGMELVTDWAGNQEWRKRGLE